MTREQEIWMRKVARDRINMMNEEQNIKNTIQFLAKIDDYDLGVICNTCRSIAKEEHMYLDLLNQIVIKLSEGYSINYISYCLKGNKYTDCIREENIMIPEKIELPKLLRGQWIPLVFEPKFVEVVDVNPIVPDKVVEVTFADGTKEKSVCREPDVFSMEFAISICISKKIMGGSSAYNNAVKRGVKVYEDKQKRETTEKEEQERIEKKRAKRLAYKERRAAKRIEEENQRKAKEREEQIAIQTEAYLRAMKAMGDSKNVVVNEENN